ncbi:MAG: PAS domain S-box protein [Gammaproteobacteria bacterium]|nr:PAS domain S-box protein [Gammaproteobacteria bacterium]
MKQKSSPTKESLEKENARLRAQLAEAQQLIDAIRRGDIDALFISDETGQQLLPVGAADKGYRQLVEEMNEGAMTLIHDGVILYANRHLAQMLKLPLERLIGSELSGRVPRQDREELQAFLRIDPNASMQRRGEFTLLTGDDAPLPVLLSLSHLAQEDESFITSLIVTDLTEQKQNETLVANERLSRSILTQASDTIVVCDPSGWIIRASRAAQRLCHCHPVGREFDECFPLRDEAGKSYSLKRLLESEHQLNRHLWFRREGLVRQLRVNTAPLGSLNDEMSGTIVTLTDVTEMGAAAREARHAREELQQQLEKANHARQVLLSVIEDEKLTENALRDSEAHFRLALGNLPIAVWNMDTELRYLWYYEHEHGDISETIIGKTDHDLYEPVDADYITRLKEKALKSGEAINKEIYATYNEHKKFYNVYIEPLHDEEGRITGLTGAAIDITDVHELEFERKKLADAVKQSASAITMVDSELHFEYINQAFTGLFGFTQEELQGKPISLITPPRGTPSQTPLQVRAIARKEGIYRGEVVRKAKDGSLIPVYITAAPLVDESGEITGFVASFNDLRPVKESEKRLQGALTDTITAIGHTIEKRDPYTAGHQTRVAQLAVAIAREMDLDQNVIEGIYLGSLIHDIGKIHIPAEILNRPGRLSENEFAIIKSHPDVGYEIIKDVKFDWPIAEMVYQHHERIDGSGYPQGLKGEAICLEAKIIAVADIVEAMTSHRPYRAGLGVETALAQIESEAGTTLDNAIVDSCLTLFREKGFSWSSSFSL